MPTPPHELPRIPPGQGCMRTEQGTEPSVANLGSHPQTNTEATQRGRKARKVAQRADEATSAATETRTGHEAKGLSGAAKSRRTIKRANRRTRKANQATNEADSRREERQADEAIEGSNRGEREKHPMRARAAYETPRGEQELAGPSPPRLSAGGGAAQRRDTAPPSGSG